MKKIKKANGNPKKIQEERKSTGKKTDWFLPPPVIFFEGEYPAIFNYRLFKEKIKSDKIPKKL